MFNRNKNNKNSELEKKPTNPVGINNNEYEEEYEFIQVNVATGDQYRKFANICSKNGQITSEMVNKFHDESTREAQQWKKNNPEVRSITFRDMQDESGKQVIKVLPTELIFPSGQRVKIYDENGNQIVGEENIRREIEKREANWEQWEKEGKLRIVDHRTHDFDDGSIATVYSRIAPIRLHENEANEVANHLGHVGKRLKIFGEESKGIEEHNKLVGSSQIKGKIVEVDDDNKMDIDQSETQTNTSTSKSQANSLTKASLLSDDEIKKASKDQLINLQRKIEKELEIREKIEADSNVQTSNYQVSTDELKDKLQKSQQLLSGFQNHSLDDKDNNGKIGIVATVGVVSALAIGGIALVKKKLGKNDAKKR